MFTQAEKNFQVCANCFCCEPSNKEFRKWLKYRYDEFVMENGGHSTTTAPDISFGDWLEKNQSREHWKRIPVV